MGNLAGFKYRVVAKVLKYYGFSFKRQAKGSHEIWVNEEIKKVTTIPYNSKTIKEGTLKAIIKQAGISEKDFLKNK